MASPELAPNHYVHDLTEAAATRLISSEDLHREDGESATDAFLWAINGGGLFNLEDALILLIDEALTLHEDQLAVETAALGATFDAGDRLEASDRLTNDHSPTYVDDEVIADWLPTGSDEEDRILSLMSLGPA